MKILVYGAGALGSTIGGFLAQEGNELTFLGRDPHIAEITKNGLRIEGIWGEHRIAGIKGITGLSGISQPDFDLVLVTVKSFDTEQAARDIAEHINANSLVISLQNGYGNYQTLANVLGRDRVLAGRVIIGFRINRPGYTEVTVFADKIAVGSPYQNLDTQARKVADLFNDANLPTFYTDEIDAYIWAKIIYNCALNPLSAILRVAYGRLGEQPETVALMDRVMTEIFSVTKRMGVKLFWDNLETLKKAFYEEMLPPTASHNSSMYQDLARGKRLEIDALNGAIVVLGKQCCVDVTVNETLVNLIKFLESR